MSSSRLQNSLYNEKKMKVSAFVSTKLTNEKHAESLAGHFFQYYNKKNKDYLDSFDVAIVLIDIYRSIGKEFKPTEEDIREYMELLDHNKDGKVTIEDIEYMMKHYLAN